MAVEIAGIAERRWVVLGAGAAILAVAIVTVLVSIAYRRDIDQAFKRISTGSQVVQTSCGPIEYAMVGAGMPVLIVHGAGGGFDQGMEFARDLAAAGLRVIAISRFGYLRTPLPADASAAAQADAHACLLDALGIRRAVIVGASAGAPSSLQFTLRHPERCAGLVLVVPATYVPRRGGDAPLRTPAWTQFLFDTALRSDFLFWAGTKLVRRVMIGAILATPPEIVEQADADERARVARLLSHILPVSPRRPGLLNDAAITSALSRYPIEGIHTPTLVMSAADDRFGTYEAARYTAERIPGARFIGYASGGHIWVGHNKEAIAEVVAFVKAADTKR
jgi:pimeloyl-ACP methyl ester carboxylesterase